jgi:hypothetical protein
MFILKLISYNKFKIIILKIIDFQNIIKTVNDINKFL